MYSSSISRVNPGKNYASLKDLFSAVWVELSVFSVNMLVQLVFRGEDLVTLLAGIFKSLRKVDIFKVVERVAFSVESLLAEGALEAVFLADHDVVFQHFPPCKRHKGQPCRCPSHTDTTQR